MDADDGSEGSDASDSSSDSGVLLEPTDLYAEPNGPYAFLHINKASEDRWENYQDKTFSNCHHDDNVSSSYTPLEPGRSYRMPIWSLHRTRRNPNKS